MALKPLNSVGGFSVGEIPVDIILANGAITTNNANISLELQANTANFDGNVVMDSWLSVANTANVGNLRTDNILYANGVPYNFGQDPGGSNTQIQFNDNGNFNGSTAFTFDKSSNVLTVSGNANVGNLGTAGLVVATGNVSGGNLTTAGVVSATGNVTGGNLTTAGVVSATGNVSGGNLNTTGNISAGNANLGNLALASFFQGDGGFLTNVSASGTLANGTSNVTIPVSGGNVNTSAGGVANVLVVTSSGANVTGTFNATGNATVANLAGGNLVSANFVAGTLTTAAQPNVTSVGTLTGLDVNGNITAANITANTGVFTGNGSGLSALVGANVTGTVANATHASTANTVVDAAQPNITSVGTLVDLTVTGNVGAGNVNAGNLLTANFVAGTLTTAAQPNVTSVGTLSSLGVTGNITTNANIVTDLIIGRTSGIQISATGVDQNIELKPTGNGTVDVWGKNVSNLATPVASTDAATKGYVDAAVEGLHIHAPCAAATPDTLAVLSGGTVTYNNGTAGVGATLTTTGSYTTIDGVNIASVGTRILVKNEANAAHNGIYVYTSSTVLTRATDFDTPTEMAGGDFTFVQNGTLYNDTGWVMTDPVTTVGTSPVNFLQFSGAGEYSAGTGLTLVGTQFSISNTTVAAASYGNGDAVATFTVNAQGQLTAASNVSITANAANLTGTTLNASIVTSSLTSVGTLSSLDVTGNIAGGNVNTAQVIASANVTAPQFISNVATGTAPLIVSSTTKVANLNADTVDGYDTDTAATGNTLVVRNTDGNITGNFFIGNGSQLTGVASAGNLANGNSFVAIPSANGNVVVTVAGNANVVTFTGTGANVAGDLTSLNANLGNLAVANFVDVSSNVMTNNLTVNLAIGGNTANFTGNVVSSNLLANGVANVGNLNVQANVTSALNPNANLTLDLGSSTQRWGNVYAGSVLASGNVTANNYITTGNVAIGNSTIEARTTITTSATLTTISEVPVSGVTGVDFIVKGADSAGGKYSVAHITAVTNGSTVDYTAYGLVNIESTTGTLSVAIVGSNIALQVVPSSINSTVWTTQFRLI